METIKARKAERTEFKTIRYLARVGDLNGLEKHQVTILCKRRRDKDSPAMCYGKLFIWENFHTNCIQIHATLQNEVMKEAPYIAINVHLLEEYGKNPCKETLEELFKGIGFAYKQHMMEKTESLKAENFLDKIKLLQTNGFEIDYDKDVFYHTEKKICMSYEWVRDHNLDEITNCVFIPGYGS